MGLFSKFKSEPSYSDFLPKNEQEAWIAIIYCCISTDDNVTDAEIDNFSRVITFKSLFDGCDSLACYKKAISAKNKVGEDKLVEESAKFIPDENKATLLAVAVDLVAADGSIGFEEEKIIENVVAALNIEPLLAENIVNVLMIRNKFNKVIID